MGLLPLYLSLTCSKREVLSFTLTFGDFSGGDFLFLLFPGEIFLDGGGLFFGDACFLASDLVKETLLALNLLVITSSFFRSVSMVSSFRGSSFDGGIRRIMSLHGGIRRT